MFSYKLLHDVARVLLCLVPCCAVREEGPGALFKGLWPNYLKVVPSIAIAFVCYEQVKELLGVEFRISE